MNVLGNRARSWPTAICGAVSVALSAATARAGIIIEFTGLNLVYNGSSLSDAKSLAGGLANPADADPLASVDVFLDGTLIGSLGNDIALDAYIPDVVNIPDGPNAVYNLTTPGNPGFFDLLIGTSPLASQFLLLDVSAMNIAFIDVSGVAQFTFGAAVTSAGSQNLPFGLEIGDPITVSFSAQIDPGTRTSAAGFVTGFDASGTGEIGGPLIPEPASGLLLLAGGLFAAGLRRRRTV